MNGEIKLGLVNGKYDIDFGSDGDFVEEKGLETAILMSLFLNERADESEVPNPVLRGGYWGYEVNEMQFSKLWLVTGRKTSDKLNKATDYCNSTLQWLVDENFATGINTVASFISDGIKLDITISKVNGVKETYTYNLWLNTNF